MCCAFWFRVGVFLVTPTALLIGPTKCCGFDQDVCMSKTQTLFQEQTAARGSANPMLVEFAKDHRNVVARFGR